MKLYKVKKSKIDNQGVYAAKNIKAGTKIIYYTGKIITKKKQKEILSMTTIKQFICLILIVDMT